MKVYVHRYRWKHEKARRLLRRAMRKGEAKLIASLNTHHLYDVTEDSLFTKVIRVLRGKR